MDNMQNDPKDLIKMIGIFSKDKTCCAWGTKREKRPYYTKILPSKIANYLVRKLQIPK